MQFDYASAHAFVTALTQAAPETTTIDVRMIHDRDKAVAAIPRRGTLPDLWTEICTWNSSGYGVFINISEMDGSGRLELANVLRVRCQALDLDNIDALQQLNAASIWQPAPAFWVNSSPNKFHVYWHTPYHADFDAFVKIQRKLIAKFGGDRRIHDPSRVLRLPGTYHHKAEPHLITCGALAGYGVIHSLDAFEHALSDVDASAPIGERHALGSVELSAPSMDWLEIALAEIDPNSLDRGEWVSLMAAFKQAGWLHATPEYLLETFMKWCSTYAADNPGETLKNWKSLTTTQVGWPAVLRKAPATFARMKFNGYKGTGDVPPLPSTPAVPAPPFPGSPAPAGDIVDPSQFDELVGAQEIKQLFAGCTYIGTLNEILGPQNTFYDSSTFNAKFGGKHYVIDSQGKVTDEAWKAATRSTLWTVPKIDHIRFLPTRPHGEMITDELGRIGINTYTPARIERREGNPQPFLDHMAKILPVQDDRNILFGYMAHVVKYPGHKIPWAPLVQSAQGIGKGVIKEVMSHAVGMIYTHFPNAAMMADSGAKFNGWMRNKLFILCDEIRVDEKRDMIEALKPLISESRIEVQSKGVDQRLDDNFTNWMFFSNFKDAIPVTSNDRRFAVFYSPLQTYSDILHEGMDETYFNNLWAWLNAGGFEIVNDWLMRYPIERGAIPMRAPVTSSTAEAINASRSPLEQLIVEAIEEGAAGFRGGYLSVTAIQARAKANGLRQPNARTVGTVLEAMGFAYLGRTASGNAHELNPHIYALRPDMPLSGYAGSQGVVVPPMPMRH